MGTIMLEEESACSMRKNMQKLCWVLMPCLLLFVLSVMSLFIYTPYLARDDRSEARWQRYVGA